MQRWNLLPVVLLVALACGGDDTAEEAAQAPAESEMAPPETAAPEGEAALVQTPAESPAPAPAPARTAPAMPAVSTPAMDEPWTPTLTGTVTPGMTRDSVIAIWGEPVAERALGAWTYLYFRNGCEASCGTFDVVFLENGQVVNAIVRGPGHIYDGTSTSPPGAEPRATIPPGGTAG